MIVLLVLLRPQLGGLMAGKRRFVLGKMGLATGGMIAVLLLITPFISAKNPWLAGISGLSLGGLTYFGLAYLLKVDELHLILQRLLRR